MASQWHMKERAPIQIQGMFLSRQSWILPMPFVASAQKQANIKTSCAEQEPVSWYFLHLNFNLFCAVECQVTHRTCFCFCFSKSLYVEKHTLMRNLCLAAEDLEWPDVWTSSVYHILSLYSNIQQAWVHSVKLTLGMHKNLSNKLSDNSETDTKLYCVTSAINRANKRTASSKLFLELRNAE